MTRLRKMMLEELQRRVGQAQDGLGDVASSSGTWLLFHDRWPTNHRSMIRVVPRCEVRVARQQLSVLKPPTLL
jgi:hypothetical protein